MFSLSHKNHSEKISRTHKTNKQQSVSILARGCSFSGKIVLEGQAHLGGVFEGQIVSTGFLCIEETACVEGDIKVADAEIRGSVSGSIVASGLLKITSSASVTGDVIANRLWIEEGASINARIRQHDDFATIETASETVFLESHLNQKNTVNNGMSIDASHLNDVLPN